MSAVWRGLFFTPTRDLDSLLAGAAQCDTLPVPEQRQLSTELADFLAADEAHVVELVQMQGMSSLLYLAGSRDVVVQRHVARALASIMPYEQVQQVFVDNGGLQILTYLNCCIDEQVREHSAEALAHLVINERGLVSQDMHADVSIQAFVFLAVTERGCLAAEALRLVSSIPDLARDIVRFGGLKPLLNLCASQDPETSLQAAMTIVNVSRIEEAKHQLVSLGAIESLSCLLSFSSDAVHKIVVTIVSEILTVTDDLEAFVGHGGVALLLKLAESPHLEIERFAASCLAQLTNEHHVRFRSATSSPASSINSSPVQSRQSLHSLALPLNGGGVADEVARELATEAGVQQLALLADSRDVQVHFAAARTLAQLACNATAAHLMVTGPSFAFLLRLSTSRYILVQREAAKSIANLCMHESLLIEILRGGVIEPLITLTRSRDSLIQGSAARALALLSVVVGAQNRTDIIDAGGLQSLVALATSDDSYVQLAASEALLNISAHATAKTAAYIVNHAALQSMLQLAKTASQTRVLVNVSRALACLSIHERSRLLAPSAMTVLKQLATSETALVRRNVACVLENLCALPTERAAAVSAACDTPGVASGVASPSISAVSSSESALTTYPDLSDVHTEQLVPDEYTSAQVGDLLACASTICERRSDVETLRHIAEALSRLALRHRTTAHVDEILGRDVLHIARMLAETGMAAEDLSLQMLAGIILHHLVTQSTRAQMEILHAGLCKHFVRWTMLPRPEWEQLATIGSRTLEHFVAHGGILDPAASSFCLAGAYSPLFRPHRDGPSLLLDASGPLDRDIDQLDRDRLVLEPVLAESPAQTTLRLKCQLGEELRMITLPLSATFADFQRVLETEYGGRALAIRYVDEEGDVISVRSQTDWEEAVELHLSHPGKLRLMLEPRKGRHAAAKHLTPPLDLGKALTAAFREPQNGQPQREPQREPQNKQPEKPSPSHSRSPSDTPREWDIDASELSLGRKIGSGAFGIVYRGVWRGTDIAAKKLLEQRLDEATMNQFKMEIEMMSKLRHPNVVLYLGACLEKNHLVIVTEYLTRGSLHRVLHSGKQDLSLALRVRMAMDTARGVSYLHHSSIVHRDLKSPNLLVNDDYTVKVCDFGLSKVKMRAYLSSGFHGGTPEWMSPEVLRSERYDESTDVYSFAIVLWELVTREVPFKSRGLNHIQIVYAVGFQHQRLAIPESCPEPLSRLIQDCWHQVPHERPRFPAILERLQAFAEGLASQDPAASRDETC